MGMSWILCGPVEVKVEVVNISHKDYPYNEPSHACSPPLRDLHAPCVIPQELHIRFLVGFCRGWKVLLYPFHHSKWVKEVVVHQNLYNLVISFRYPQFGLGIRVSSMTTRPSNECDDFNIMASKKSIFLSWVRVLKFCILSLLLSSFVCMEHCGIFLTLVICDYFLQCTWIVEIQSVPDI